MGRLLTRVTQSTTTAHVRHVRPVAPASARGLVAEVYRQASAEFGMLAPPLVLHSPAPGPLTACWLLLRETMLADGRVGREAKELVATAVSLANRCPYCVEVHGATLAGLVGGTRASAIAAHGLDAVSDPELRALGRWAYASGADASRERPRPPFPLSHAPELMGVVVTFQYLNRMVNVFLQDSPLPPVPAVLLGGVRRMAARVMGSLARTGHQPGRSLELLPQASMPPDLAWAAEAPLVADAMARAYHTIDAASVAAVPDRVRRLVREHLARRPGFVPALGETAWLDDAVVNLPAGERPAGRLALLTATTSYRVTDALIAEVRAYGHDDKALIELTSWASLTAARRIGDALHNDLTSDACD